MRRANVFSQVLGIAATTYIGSLSDAARTRSRANANVWKQHGYLLSFEGLLSAAGKELGMIEDVFVGVAMLRMVQVLLVQDDGQSVPSRTKVVDSPFIRWIELRTTGQHASRRFSLLIGIIPSYYEQRVPAELRNNVPVQLYPLLFEVGVDIRQWGANAGTSVLSQLAQNRFDTDLTTPAELGAVTSGMINDEDDDVGIQDDDVLVQLNFEGFRLLNAYICSVSPQEVTQASSKIHPRLETLYEHILGSAGKMNHGILVEAASLCRQLSGGAVVFCVSPTVAIPVNRLYGHHANAVASPFRVVLAEIGQRPHRHARNV
jgi:hypothetical protein